MDLKIRRALISVSDKSGVIEFAKALNLFKVEILSTGGTFSQLRSAGIEVKEVSAYTGFPEILDGRVKTLHPKIHGAILAKRNHPAHQAALEKHGITPIDLLVVNLYPFATTVAHPDCSMEQAVENIDIGGLCMIRAAAKNHTYVTVVTDVQDYVMLLEEMREKNGAVSQATRTNLARKAFARTAQYDSSIANYLYGQAEGQFPAFYSLTGKKLGDLRYGENPHQRAAFYEIANTKQTATVAGSELKNGKTLSYNNILDLEAALSLVKEFSDPTAVVIKHNNPCGCAVRSALVEALQCAWQGDPVSAFGSVIACNREIDKQSAEFLVADNRFVEAVIAPNFSAQAFEILTQKPKWGQNVRLLACGTIHPDANGLEEVRGITGGFLLQTKDQAVENQSHGKVMTQKNPTAEQLKDLYFAQVVAKHVKSNAIVFVRDQQVVGVGAGQMSRVDAVQIAIEKAGARVKNSVLGSDAFFPFPDGIEKAAKAGIVAAIQPGGSLRDREVIQAADKLGLAMVFTGVRHFLH